jgi:hypothetical protein
MKLAIPTPPTVDERVGYSAVVSPNVTTGAIVSCPGSVRRLQAVYDSFSVTVRSLPYIALML